jgi:hypothetical protein
MATDDDDHEERVRRGAARHRAEQAFLDARDEAARLAETGMQYKDKDRKIQAKMALNRMQQGSAATPRARKKWDGPMDNRPKVDGKALVSAEELADFRQKFGADKTLRDLLNADKGRGPSAASPAARGMQGANVAPRGPRIRPDEAATTPSVGLSDIPGLLMRGMAEGAERVPAGRGLGAAFVGAGLPRAVAGARAAGTGWRNRPPEGADPAKWKEIVKQIDEAYPGGTPFKKGGKVKAYAKGGSVRGGGCETRIKKTKYV